MFFFFLAFLEPFDRYVMADTRNPMKMQLRHSASQHAVCGDLRVAAFSYYLPLVCLMAK